MTNVLERLAADYPQLYLNPDTDSQEAYRRVVLRGETPQTKSLAHYRGDRADRDEIADTPAGCVRVVTLGNRQDFELALRSLIAAKDGPLVPIPESQGAAMLTVFNWPRPGFPGQALYRRTAGKLHGRAGSSDRGGLRCPGAHPGHDGQASGNGALPPHSRADAGSRDRRNEGVNTSNTKF